MAVVSAGSCSSDSTSSLGASICHIGVALKSKKKKKQNKNFKLKFKGKKKKKKKKKIRKKGKQKKKGQEIKGQRASTRAHPKHFTNGNTGATVVEYV